MSGPWGNDVPAAPWCVHQTLGRYAGDDRLIVWHTAGRMQKPGANVCKCTMPIGDRWCHLISTRGPLGVLGQSCPSAVAQPLPYPVPHHAALKPDHISCRGMGTQASAQSTSRRSPLVARQPTPRHIELPEDTMKVVEAGMASSNVRAFVFQLEFFGRGIWICIGSLIRWFTWAELSRGASLQMVVGCGL